MEEGQQPFLFMDNPDNLSMADIHLDDFFRDCAKILVSLHGAFPRLTSLFVDDIIPSEPLDEFGIPSRRHQACFDAFIWLAEEGYIRYHDRVRTEGFDEVVLTEKSIVRLCKPVIEISSDENKPALIGRKQASLTWQLKQALKSGTTDQINQLCMKLFAH